MFYEIVVLKNLSKFTAKHLRRPAVVLKRNSGTGFAVNLANVLGVLYYRTPLGDCFNSISRQYCDIKTPHLNAC